MKVNAPQVSGVLRDLQRFAGVLLHGDDAGLVRERGRAASMAVTGLGDDPFRSCVLTREEHGRVMDEARAQSLLGGRRAVRVLEAGEALAPVIDRLDSAQGALVVMEAGSLPARSKLRKAADASAAWASITCNPETGRGLINDMRLALKESGFDITDDALVLLARDLSPNSALRRSELDKLTLFCQGEREIGLDMVAACGISGVEVPLNQMLTAVMAGGVVSVCRLMPELIAQGVTGPALVVGLAGRLHRVLRLRLEVAAGRGLEEAVRALTPPVYFRDVPGLMLEVRSWPEVALTAVLAEARVADLACKRAGGRDTSIASQLYVSTARRAARLRQS